MPREMKSMPMSRRLPATSAWTIVALAGLIWAVIALAFAALGPGKYVPHVFFSYHIEHFVAFYIVALLSAAGLPRTRLYRIGLCWALMAVVLGLVRSLTPAHRYSAAEDTVADIAGAFAALGPIWIGRFRELASRSLGTE